MGGPADTSMVGGARGAALGAVMAGSAVTGAIIGGAARAIRASNAYEPAGTCSNVKTNRQVPWSK